MQKIKISPDFSRLFWKKIPLTKMFGITFQSQPKNLTKIVVCFLRQINKIAISK